METGCFSSLQLGEAGSLLKMGGGEVFVGKIFREIFIACIHCETDTAEPNSL